MNYTRSLGGLALLLAAGFVTCKSEERAGLLGDDNGLTYVPPNLSRDAGGGDETPDPASDLDAGADGGFATTGNCGTETCRGAGKCQQQNDGMYACVCDDGYELVDGECVVDENCIELRLLEPGCRQLRYVEPALAMFFNVETCAGTTVLPSVLGDPTLAFKIIEDDSDLGNESYAAVLPRPVESFVAIAVDLSGSVASNAGLLSSLLGAVEVLVEDLKPAEGEAPVSVELLFFGRSVSVDLPFTNDLDAVKARLRAVAADTTGVVADPNGTNLNGVVNSGMYELSTVLEARRAATGGAIVATGTLITITDGEDTAGETLDALDPRFNSISIGVSADINDTELTRIGPQGSFLAPTSADWNAAFDTVASRVAEYPKRAYLLTYCSPAVAGTHEVIVTLANGTAAQTATCEFDAEDFGVGNGVCTEAFIQNYCTDGEHGCGTLLACNECPGMAPPLPETLVNERDFWRYPGENDD